MKVDLDAILFEYLQRTGKSVAWTTPMEISGGDVNLARQLGCRMGRHIKETRSKNVVIGERRYEYRHGKRIVCYRIADLSAISKRTI